MPFFTHADPSSSFHTPPVEDSLFEHFSRPKARTYWSHDRVPTTAAASTTTTPTTKETASRPSTTRSTSASSTASTSSSFSNSMEQSLYDHFQAPDYATAAAADGRKGRGRWWAPW
ncbi:hypothetical protein F4778DRAFT_784023 [Xylariomycetidae sp. FL2044]|nr:hypothetical protein F4778DRAFT_784023 [Xylariomycetidae sp. FL2044]